jgi:hypothetical protein
MALLILYIQCRCLVAWNDDHVVVCEVIKVNKKTLLACMFGGDGEHTTAIVPLSRTEG